MHQIIISAKTHICVWNHSIYGASFAGISIASVVVVEAAVGSIITAIANKLLNIYFTVAGASCEVRSLHLTGK